MAQCKVLVDHLGEIEAHALEQVRLQRHCNSRDEDHIVVRHPAKAAIESTQIKRGRSKGGLTEGLALDLLVEDGAREVEVVHLLLGRLLLRGFRRRGCVGGRERGWGHVGGRWRRRRRGRAVAYGGAHGGGGACGGFGGGGGVGGVGRV